MGKEDQKGAGFWDRFFGGKPEGKQSLSISKGKNTETVNEPQQHNINFTWTDYTRTLGRVEGNPDIVLTNSDGEVSKHHAIIYIKQVIEAGEERIGLFIKDNNSANGTFIRRTYFEEPELLGEKAVELKGGEYIDFGTNKKTVFRVLPMNQRGTIYPVQLLRYNPGDKVIRGNPERKWV